MREAAPVSFVGLFGSMVCTFGYILGETEQGNWFIFVPYDCVGLYIINTDFPFYKYYFKSLVQKRKFILNLLN